MYNVNKYMLMKFKFGSDYENQLLGFKIVISWLLIDVISFKLSVGDRNIQVSCYKVDIFCRKMFVFYLIFSLCY